MKIKLSGKTSRFAKRTLADFSEKMIVMLTDMPLEEISVQKICDVCNYPRSTFYNYFDDIYDLMDYCWTTIIKDMNIEKYLNVQKDQNTEQIFSILYEYFDQYRLQIHRILLKNGLEGRCMASLRVFMKKQIRQIISMCPGTKDFPVREDVMVDYYAAMLEMLLEKCFFTKEQLSKEEALQAVRFLLGSVEKEAHKNDFVFQCNWKWKIYFRTDCRENK